MKKVEDLNYYELLNVEPSATAQEIEKAYLLSLAAFRPDWFATYSVLSDAERAQGLRRAELAFEVLRDPVKRRKYDEALCQAPPRQIALAVVEKSRPAPPKPTPPAETPGGLWGRLKSYLSPNEEPESNVVCEAPAEAEPVSLSEDYALSVGQYLRTVRISRGLSLQEVAQYTRISVAYLRALEDEQYKELPSESHVLYMLAAYAKSLKVDADRVVRDFKASRKG